MKVLGLSFDYHDAAAALLVNGRIVAAAQQERFSRKKNDAGFPLDAARFCLAQGGLSISNLDAVVHYETPILKFDRILRTSLAAGNRGDEYRDQALRQWLQAGKFEVAARIAEYLDAPPERIHLIQHHDSHLASAFYPSPFQQAAIVTLDGVGEYDTAAIGYGDGTSITRLADVKFPHSLGLFYSAMTAFLGFEVNEGEYKVMGMAAYGQPVLAESMLALFQFHDDGRFDLDTSWFDFLAPTYPFTDKLTGWLGAPRRPEEPFFAHGQGSMPTAAGKRYADIAASVQRCAEEVILHTVRAALRITGARSVCLAGGVALNSLANGRIRRELAVDLYVQPAAGDAGGALGAAAWWHHLNGGSRMAALSCPYLGREFDDATVERALASSRDMLAIERFDRESALLERVATALAQGSVVGWFQGRSEWGPRALGHRSILASPLHKEMQSVVNEKIKFREPFRPFAPSVPAELAQRYFDLPEARHRTSTEEFMLAVHPVRASMRANLPAITHADGTARVHTVFEDTNPLFYGLLHAFGHRTGVPILLNTSFNLRGEPIVDAPDDALRTFWNSGMDYLVLGSILVSKQVSL
jgi:carbamoyltransferase